MTSRQATRALLLLCTGALLAACAARPVVSAPPPVLMVPPRDDLFVVLPGPDGKAGAVTVTHGREQQVLDSPYAGARIRERGHLEAARVPESEVRESFGETLGALPPRPVSVTVFFEFSRDELTADSHAVLRQISVDLARRPAVEVVVIGHTDRVGTLEANDTLSLQRAARVRRELVEAGVAADRIEIAGRGEREPLVPTEDEVPEPRNRRVEIIIR